MNEITQATLSYVAGLLDGEGCFTVHRTKARNGRWLYQPTIKCEMTNPAAIYLLQDFTGLGTVRGTASRGANRRNTWVWRVTGPEAAELADALIPLLVVKQDQARKLVELGAHIQNNKRNPFEAHDEHTWEVREAIWTEVKRLNNVGY